MDNYYKDVFKYSNRYENQFSEKNSELDIFISKGKAVREASKKRPEMSQNMTTLSLLNLT